MLSVLALDILLYILQEEEKRPVCIRNNDICTVGFNFFFYRKQEYLFAAYNPDQEDTIRKKSLSESIRNSFRKKPPVAAENIIVLNNFAEKGM